MSCALWQIMPFMQHSHCLAYLTFSISLARFLITLSELSINETFLYYLSILAALVRLRFLLLHCQSNLYLLSTRKTTRTSHCRLSMPPSPFPLPWVSAMRGLCSPQQLLLWERDIASDTVSSKLMLDYFLNAWHIRTFIFQIYSKH